MWTGPATLTGVATDTASTGLPATHTKASHSRTGQYCMLGHCTSDTGYSGFNSLIGLFLRCVASFKLFISINNIVTNRILTKFLLSCPSFTQIQLSPKYGRMPLPALSLWPSRQPYRPRVAGGRRGGGPSYVAPCSRNPPTGRRRRDSLISSRTKLFTIMY